MLIPLSKLSYDTSTLARLAKEGLSINIGSSAGTELRVLDLLRQTFKGPCYPDEFGPLLRHYWQSFLIVDSKDHILPLILESGDRLSINLTNTNNEDIAIVIVSADLLSWHDTIVTNSLSCTTKSLRRLMNEIQAWFESQGLYVFHKYRKKKHVDGTLLLEEKR